MANVSNTPIHDRYIALIWLGTGADLRLFPADYQI